LIFGAILQQRLESGWLPAYFQILTLTLMLRFPALGYYCLGGHKSSAGLHILRTLPWNNNNCVTHSYATMALK